ncbi:domain KxDL [Penicillium sp. IBT 35674x]|nr:domain KxDL [Penicillium sp. IBT 35674x]
MAAHRQYYQPSAMPMSMPSKAPAPASMYPVSRVPGSPTDYSDASTTAGSRTSGGLTFSSAGGDYDSSSASYSGVDVVDVLSDRMQNAFDPTPLDKSLASQAQTSGQMRAKQQELLELQAMAQRRMKGLRANFNEGLKTARETKRDLEWTQKRVSALKSKAEKAHPDEYRRASKKYTYDDY